MLYDLRISIRQLLHKPAFTLAIIATLALGIGANSAIFSLINAVLLEPLPYPDPDRLVRIWGRTAKPDIPQLLASEGEVLDYQKKFNAFEAVAGYAWREGNLTSGDQPERVRIYYTSYELWKVLGVQPLLGNTFGEADDKPGAPQVVVLSYGVWRRNFGGDPAIIGKSIDVNLTGRTVLGVMPPGFEFPEKADLWSPLRLDPANLQWRQNHYIEVIARLKPGITIDQATADLRLQTSRWPVEYAPGYTIDGGWDTYVVSLLEQEVGDVRRALFTLLGAVGFVLLITCANVGSMLLLRVESRAREILVRASLGARRGALVRQFALESLVLSLAGGLIGLAAASWAIRGVVLLYPDAIPRATGVGLDGRVVAFTLALALLTGLLISLIPAWHAARPDLSQALKEAGASTTGSSGKMRIQRALVVVQIALSIALLAGAGSMLRSFFNLRQEAIGFSRGQVLTAQLALPRLRYTEAPVVNGFFRDLNRRLAAEPGVVAVGATSYLPLTGTFYTSTVSAEGRAAVAGQPQPEPSARSCTPGYFEALGIPLLAGRGFTDQDDSQAPLVAVVDQRLAESLWPRQDPLGRRLRLGPPDVPPELLAEHPWRTVVGVIGNVRDNGPAVPPSTEGTVYFPLAQQVERALYLAVRTEKGDPLALGGALRRHVKAIDGDQPVADVQTMEQRLGKVLARQRLSTVLLASFGILALALASLGVYSVIAQTVARRHREIAIRMALGADRGSILSLMLKRGVGVVVVGVAAGLALSFALARLLGQLLYGIEASDPLTFVGVALLLSAVALLAVFWPARRASRLQPMTAFRQE
ncbi:MAG TPA: ABC transporter permease [Thermoanaerobaculia bacterium]|nr:ABC transporter permease [Thermoanaerobaculia bacterium]